MRDLITNPGRKAMVIGIVLAALNHITGSYALLSYTATIFKESGSLITPNESALVNNITDEIIPWQKRNNVFKSFYDPFYLCRSLELSS